MANAKLNGADYLLLLLYLDNKTPILGAVRITKMMFLFNKEISGILKSSGLDSEKLPEFFSYDFGPFSTEVYEQIELFRGIKFIKATNVWADEDMAEVDDREEDPFEYEFIATERYTLYEDGKYMKYEIADLGSKFVEKELLPKISTKQKGILESFKNKMNALSSKQILKYVYTKYPDFTGNSLIKQEVLNGE